MEVHKRDWFFLNEAWITLTGFAQLWGMIPEGWSRSTPRSAHLLSTQDGSTGFIHFSFEIREAGVLHPQIPHCLGNSFGCSRKVGGS